MTRKIFIFHLLCLLGLIVFSAYSWLTLPDMEQYPIHWNAKGEVDGFASRTGVFWTLTILPITQIFMVAIFHFLPKIEPMRKNFEASRSAYDIICIFLAVFMTSIGVVLCFVLSNPGTEIAKFIPKGVIMAISLLYVGIGNVLGKMRQNYMMGIRTPWTLSSELSWEKTHRLAGRVFVIGGIIGLFMTIFIPASSVLPLIIGFIAITNVIVLVPLVYSYLVWKKDPQKSMKGI